MKDSCATGAYVTGESTRNWRDNPRIEQAARALQQGQVVAYPTEAVWGLGADPFNQAAVDDILQLKQRPVEKGVILLAADMAQLDFLLADLPAAAREELSRVWPAPITYLIPHHNRVPAWICGDFDTVAVRVTDHPVAAGLARAFGGPIVSTSCNPAGEVPARNLAEARGYFATHTIPVNFCSGVVGNQTNPSLIRDLDSDRVIRSA